MKNDIVALILTAGKGTRMKSKLIKNLHLLSGKPIIKYTIDAAQKAGASKIALVIGNDADKMKETLGPEYTYIYQHEQLGTAHAVMQAREFIEQNIESTIMVLLGDGPLFTGETLANMVAEHQQAQASATLLTSIKDNPYGYGRVIRDKNGKVLYTVEEKDANESERDVTEVWTGMSCFEAKDLLASLSSINNDNAQGEYYIPDTFKYLVEKGKTVLGTTVQNDSETLNVNDRVSLSAAEKYLNDKYLHELMLSGVTIVSPETTIIETSVKIAPDTTILPFTYLTGSSTIGTDCVIGPYSHLINSVVGNNVCIERSTILNASVNDNAVVGPFAYLRPNTFIKEGAKVGRFVELKNTTIGEGSKVPHLSYVGDAEVGDKVNLGAGSIVVNYDGHQKHHTVIEDGAFIGCNANLIAPVKIEKNAYVAAGSTVNKDVPANALAVARSKQVNKENWVLRHQKIREEQALLKEK